MDILTTEQLRSIIEASNPPCVSIFMPTHQQGRDTRQDPIELKNLLRVAEERLVEKGMRGTEARDLLEPARLLLEDNDFWQHSQQGLALFLAKGFFEAYRVPIQLQECCVVNDRFDIKPLLPLLETRRFYVLAVSDNHVRLLECTPRTCRQIRLPEDVALTLQEAVPGEDEHQTHTMRHGGDASNPFSGGGAYHGQTIEPQEELRNDRLFFYRQIDDGLRKVIPNEKDCLIIAAADSVAPFYKQTSRYKTIHDEFIHGNPEHVSSEQLHAQGCDLMAEIWHKELNELQDQFGSAMARQLASRDVKEIVPAASMGRVGILFVSTGSTHWGKVMDNREVVDADESTSGAEDLIDRAAVETLLTQGQVVVVEPDEMPGNGELAAIYRY